MRQGIKEKDIRGFEKYAEKLADVMRRIQGYNPGAHIYVCMDDLLLFGELEHRNGEEIASVCIPGTDCGEW